MMSRYESARLLFVGILGILLTLVIMFVLANDLNTFDTTNRSFSGSIATPHNGSGVPERSNLRQSPPTPPPHSTWQVLNGTYSPNLTTTLECAYRPGDSFRCTIA